MSPLRFGSPETLPANVLFPEAYERTKRMIILDFAYFGTAIVATVVAAAVFFQSF